MRLLVSLWLGASIVLAGPFDYHVFGAREDGWGKIFSSVGLQPGPPDSARVLVVRQGAGLTTAWADRVERGAILLLEGESPVAESFGFKGSKDRVRVGRIEDARRPTLEIIWERALDLPRYTVPKEARVFAKEHWTGAPVLAGFARGAGAVLWVIANPGPQGYERFPYVLHALVELGLKTPFRSNRLWVFFDYSYRIRADIEYLAARWRAAGIAALHVASWHFYEPDKERDLYLRKLIETCHRHGILVYAWLELPHVSEKFWNDHPGWREKTAVLQDAHLDWRKLMNLSNRDCFRTVARGVEELIDRFDWDGVNLAELYFESLEGAGNPSRFTPMNTDVREQFRAMHGVDPLTVFSTQKDNELLRKLLDFRAELARRMQEEWLGEMERHRLRKPDLDIVLTHVDDRFDQGMRDAIGADAARVLPLLQKFDFTFLIEDPATVWNMGPQRYPEIARRYQPLTKRHDRLAIDINVVERYQDVYPTKQQTGAELFQLVHLASGAFHRVAVYFENSILPPDWALLPVATASARVETSGSKWVVRTEGGVGVDRGGEILVDGKPWPVSNGTTAWLPQGTHVVEPGGQPPPIRIVDFNGDLQSAEVLEQGVRIAYKSGSRALAIVERQPTQVRLDDEPLPVEAVSPGFRGWVLRLPRGSHTVTIR